MLSHHLTNVETQKYYQNEPRFNGVYSRNNFPKIKVGKYVISFGEYESIGTNWRALYVNGDNGNASNGETWFDSFGVEHILKKRMRLVLLKMKS